jgi:hypothetical protein
VLLRGGNMKEITNPVEDWTIEELEKLIGPMLMSVIEKPTTVTISVPLQKAYANKIVELLTKPKPKPLYVYWGHNWKKEKSPKFDFNVCEYFETMYVVPESINIRDYTTIAEWEALAIKEGWEALEEGKV